MNAYSANHAAVKDGMSEVVKTRQEVWYEVDMHLEGQGPDVSLLKKA